MEKTIRKTRPIVIGQILDGVIIPENSLILEPSAGSGDLVDGILSKYPTVNVDCIELNKELREELLLIGYNVIGNDFIKQIPKPIYDFVIACPTYKNNVDIEHIMHMYNFLKPGGKLISLTYPSWTMQNLNHQRVFRKWLEDKQYSMKMLNDFSFIENYETQPSMIITIYKQK